MVVTTECAGSSAALAALVAESSSGAGIVERTVFLSATSPDIPTIFFSTAATNVPAVPFSTALCAAVHIVGNAAFTAALVIIVAVIECVGA